MIGFRFCITTKPSLLNPGIRREEKA